MIDQILKDHTDYIEIDIYYNGALSAATGVKIATLKDPNNVTLASNIVATTGDTVGRYKCSIPDTYTSSVGVYTANWQFTIDGSTFDHAQQFEVVTTLTSGYVSPIEVRNASTYSKITASSPTDAVLQKYIDKSTQLIDSFLGGSLIYSQYVDKVRCVLDKTNDGLMIPLKHRPIVSVTSVSVETTPDSSSTLSTSYLRIRNEAGYLDYYYPVTSPYSVIPIATVSYTAGYASMPEDVKMAATMIVEGLLMETEGDDKQINRITIGDYTEAYASSSASSPKTSLGDTNISGALKILKKYKQPAESPGLVGIYG